MEILDLKNNLLELIDEKKGIMTEVVEIGKLTSIADFLIVTEATSSRYIRTIAQNLKTGMKKFGISPVSVEGIDSSECSWALVDYGDIIVHIMTEEARKRIRIEDFWKKEIFEMISETRKK